MFNPFQKLEVIEAETFTSLPSEFRKRRRTQWSDRHGQEVECYLEGPSCKVKKFIFRTFGGSFGDLLPTQDSDGAAFQTYPSMRCPDTELLVRALPRSADDLADLSLRNRDFPYRSLPFGIIDQPKQGL